MEWEERFQAEFTLDKPSGIAPLSRIKVIFPSWLAEKDQNQVLDAVDSYALATAVYYKWAGEHYDFSTITVMIHDNPGGFVAGTPTCCAWAIGWCIGNTLIVSWGIETDESGKPCGLAKKDILPALPHEFFHLFFKQRYGDSDAGHYLYFPDPEVILGMLNAKEDSEPVELSEESLEEAKKFRYNPWIVPIRFM
jgi:hypothetical protein